MHWICSQIGAREHYAIPRVLHRVEKLQCLYTDIWGGGTMWQAMGSFLGRSMLASRFHKELATAEVKSFDLSTLVDKTFGGGAAGNPYNWFLSVGCDFGRSVEASLKHRKNTNWPETIFFGYDTGFLEPALWVQKRGAKTVVCQMDPSRFEVELVKEEERLWPGWTRRSVNVPESYFKRREEEWAAAHLVMVNSEWSRQALIRQGVPEKKLLIVPLAYEINKNSEVRNQESGRGLPNPEFRIQNPLKVLFLGQVILRKGIQYLIEAARLLKNDPVHFDVVGPIGISEDALKSAPNNMTFYGAISRDKSPDFFSNSHVFVLPTISDGFAITQIEAMAYGLPVITTSYCGEVVSNGVDGLICEVRDINELVNTIKSFLEIPERLSLMREAARFKAAQFGLGRLAESLALVEERLANISC
jgi:glycosyltransferase involved in cell wall biosynthesis